MCFGWFVYFYTHSRNYWPPLLVTVLYLAALTINFFSPASILFDKITELTAYSMPSGDIIYLANGTANPFRIIADIAWLILLFYTATASIIFGRSGHVKKAIVFGITIFLCLGLGYLQGTLIDFDILPPPYLGSFLFLPLSLVMSFSLAGDVVNASRLTTEIKNAEARWRKLLENVNLIILGVDQNKNIFYVNPYFLTATGYEKSEIINLPFIDIIPEDEREAMTERLSTIFKGLSAVKPERRMPILTKSGEQRQILWSNVEVAGTEGSISGTLSIGKDITAQDHAETSRDFAIQELESLKLKLEKENISLKEMIKTDHGFKEIVGKSNGILYALTKIQQVVQKLQLRADAMLIAVAAPCSVQNCDNARQRLREFTRVLQIEEAR